MSTEAALEPRFEEIGESVTAVMRRVVTLETLPPFFDSAFATLPRVIAGQSAAITGPAFCLYHSMAGAEFDLEAGFPVDRAITPDSDVFPHVLPGGRVARSIHAGSFELLGEAWERLGAWIAEQGVRPAQARWEVYLTEPSPEMDPADLRTELNWSISPA